MAIYKFEEEKTPKDEKKYQKISGIVCVAVSFVALVCLITRFFPFIKGFLLGMAGLFCYPFFITLMAVGFALIGHKKYVMPKKYGILISLSLIFLLCILQLILVKNNGLSFWQFISRCYSQKITAGGLIIGLVTAPFLYILNRLGAYIILSALAIIFIALSVDYIHYLNKNEDLKKAIAVEKNINKNQSPQRKITVSQLEQTVLNNADNVEDKKVSEKVKITLDAKEEEETSEESAKRKLGLLASSNDEPVDNTRYFKNDINEDLVESSTTKPIHSSKDSQNLNRIQTNFMELKEKASKMSYPISNSSMQNSGLFTNDAQLKKLEVENHSMPSKVLHGDDEINMYQSDFPRQTSIMGSQNQLYAPKKFVYDNEEIAGNNIFEEKMAVEEQTEKNNTKNTPEQTSFKESVKNLDFNQVEPIFVEEKPRHPIDIDDFTSSVLSSTKIAEDENINYISPSNMFKEERQSPEPIMPKKHVKYVPPPIELLTTQSMDLSVVNSEAVRKREELEMALDTFGIPAKCIGVVIGPSVTRYELEMPAGVTIRRLISLQDDIAYSLSSHGSIRIEAPIPGRRAVGIEVPNESIATVGLRDIILSPEFMESKEPLTIALGKDISNQVKTFNMVKIPHLLVAGATASGKSVCINSIILSLIYKFSPEDLKLILVDPKLVEFAMYNNLPHLIMPDIISDSEMALNALAWCADEMDRRYLLFGNSRVKNLEEYNQSKDVLEGRAEKLPYIVFIIDELAELLMTSKKEVEDLICRILQKARASGIHMILATQRPSVDVVTGKIKTNLNARICFYLQTFADSKTVLDQGGAEKLLGKGDMLFSSSDTSMPKRVQGCFVTTKEIDNVVTFIKENNKDFEFDLKTQQAIKNPKKDDAVSSVDGDRASSDGFDALMPQVLKSVIESGHASISMIQRKFLVGFPRAARIIDQMEMAGYISPSDGSKSRSVYMTMEEYEKMYGEE